MHCGNGPLHELKLGAIIERDHILKRNIEMTLNKEHPADNRMLSLESKLNFLHKP
mgnify:CR=1 FL=1